MAPETIQRWPDWGCVKNCASYYICLRAAYNELPQLPDIRQVPIDEIIAFSLNSSVVLIPMLVRRRRSASAEERGELGLGPLIWQRFPSLSLQESLLSL